MFRRMHRRSRHEAVVPVLAAALVVSASNANAEKPVTGLDVRARFGFGHDSNSYREANAVDPGYFMPYDIRAEYETRLDKASQFQLTAAADGQQYLGSVSDGGELDFDLDLDYARRLMGAARRSAPGLDVELRGFFDINRRTYISRAAGEEYTVDFQGVPVPLGERFNSKNLGTEAEMRLRWPRNTVWSTGFYIRHRNYDNDYEEIPEVDRLDNRHTEARFEVVQDLATPVRLLARYAYEVTDYYDRAVRDLNGDNVDGVAQSFFFNSLGGEVRCDLGRRGRASLQSTWEGRQDPYQGYYDSTQWSIEPEVRMLASARLELRASYEYAHRTYERAHVNFDPLAPLRDDHEHHVLLQGTYHLNPSSSFFLLVAHDNVDEENPVYTYDRTRSAAGYELRY